MRIPEFNQAVIGFPVLDFGEWAHWSQTMIADPTRTEGKPVLTLPPFQRSAVWRPTAALDLWRSLLDGLPIGLFYLVRGNAGRQIKAPAEGDGQRLVLKRAECDGYDLLDGQQRLRALALGWPDDRFRQKRCLWVRFTERGYDLLLTSAGQPFGYAKDGNKLGVPQRRAARERIEPNPENNPLKLPDSREPAFDSQLFEHRFVGGLEHQAHPPYPHGCGPADTAKLSDLLQQYRENRALGWPPAASEQARQKLTSGFDALRRNQVALMTLEASRFTNGNCHKLVEFFTSVGAGGTALSQDEQLYSAYKVYKPEVLNTVEDIHAKVSAVLASAKIVSTALRIANSQRQEPGSGVPDLNVLIKALEGDDKEKELDEKLRPLLDQGGLSAALATVKQLLSRPSESNGALAESAFWLPDVLLASLDIGVRQVLALWAVVRSAKGEIQADPASSREEVVCFALFWHLCVTRGEVAVRRCFDELGSPNAQSVFPGMRLYHALTRQGDAAALKLAQPAFLKKIFLIGEDKPMWLSQEQRVSGAADVADIAMKWWRSHKTMLPWLQRDYLVKRFPGYMPLSDHEDDLPFDYDHISPRAHWQPHGNTRDFGAEGDILEKARRENAGYLGSTLAISGWVACGFGEAVEERAGDCRHVPGVRGR